MPRKVRNAQPATDAPNMPFGDISQIMASAQQIAQSISSGDKEKINNAGFVDYITKPLNKEKIFELLEKIFAQKETILSENEKNDEGFLF